METLVYKVWWKRQSDGATIPAGEYQTLNEAETEAKEPISIYPEPCSVVVTDSSGAVVFSTGADDA